MGMREHPPPNVIELKRKKEKKNSNTIQTS